MNLLQRVQLKTLFLDTIKKEYRSKTLITLFVLTSAMIILANALLQFAMGFFSDDNLNTIEISQLSLNLFYNFIDLWSVFIASLLGVNCLKSDFSNRVVGQLLSFPIRRFDYLIARLLGVLALVSGYYLFSLLFAGLLFSFTSETFLIEMKFFLALFNSSLIIFASLCFAVGFSLIFPKLMAFFVTMITMGLVSLANGFALSFHFESYIEQGGFFQIFVMGLHWIFPRVGVFSQYTNEILTEPSVTLSGEYIFHLLHYGVSLGLLIFAINYFFKSKDL